MMLPMSAASRTRPGREGYPGHGAGAKHLLLGFHGRPEASLPPAIYTGPPSPVKDFGPSGDVVFRSVPDAIRRRQGEAVPSRIKRHACAYRFRDERSKLGTNRKHGELDVGEDPVRHANAGGCGGPPDCRAGESHRAASLGARAG